MQRFFYDEQIRRFLLQISRVFSNFQVEYGKDDAGNVQYKTVPVRYGNASEVVNAIIRRNSENTMIPTPMMAFYITALDYRRDWLQNPTHVDKMHIRQRDFDENSGEFTTTQGNAFTIERLMPAPHTMTINVDIWTSNLSQKHMLIEQISWIFNPALEIQSTDNYIDWTSLTRMERTGLVYSNRNVPSGTDDSIDIATFTFELPIWITPPAKQKKLGVIKTIIASVFDESGSFNDGIIDNDLLLGNRVKTTWNNYSVLLLNGEVQLLEDTNTVVDQNDPLSGVTRVGEDTVTWKAFLDAFGDFQNGISQLRITLDDDTDVVGTVSLHPADDYKLLYNVDTDTIPTNSLDAVNKIIDPLRSGPGAGLAAATNGQRYLITQDVGDANNTDGPDAWGSLVASANDIVEYTGGAWAVSFDASATTSTQYVSNLTTSIQYKWDGTQWILSYQGIHRSGNWSIVI